ncbi:MAG: hypothetical protein MZV64_73305 [Ignavibacteriales bacterium]|nr:hypothetical protein [Ignavibacteriales bacterium]
MQVTYGLSRLVPPDGDPGRLGVRDRGVDRRRAARLRAAWLKAASARSTWSAALMTVASAVIVHAFVTDDYSIKLRPALLGHRAAALLQDHLVLGRPRRLDHVLGLPAGAVRVAGGLREPRARTAS